MPRTTSIWQRDSQPTASGKPGAVHYIFSPRRMVKPQLKSEAQYDLLQASGLPSLLRRPEARNIYGCPTKSDHRGFTAW
jgi:hypothetical protein